jgi:antagonist of KipI
VTARVVSPGLLTTVQDIGRIGHQRVGIPVSGAMDRVALRIGNLLLGNDERAAGLEMTIVAPSLAFESDALFAIAGPDWGAVLDDQPIPSWHATFAPRGATLKFHGAPAGCRAYLALGGGIDVPPVLGSRSTYLRAAFGGHEGRTLRIGDVLQCGLSSSLSRRITQSIQGRPSTVARWSVGPSLRPAYRNEATISLLPGTHTGYLTADARRRLFDEEFRISTQSDRMGYRLTGPTLELQAPLELLSEGVAFGTVQLPPGGSPIVLMADGQTTGGYPRIGEVASVDLPALAQLRPGDRVRFTPISLADAQRRYVEREQEIAQLRKAIELRHP